MATTQKTTYELMKENWAKPVTEDAYKNVKAVVDAKGMWTESSYKGSDPSQHAKAAEPYYQALYDTGYGDWADYLKQSDYTTALNFLNSIPNLTTTSGASQSFMDTLNRTLGTDRGEEKKQYVIDFLTKQGFKVDIAAIDALIEAAVFELPKADTISSTAIGFEMQGGI